MKRIKESASSGLFQGTTTTNSGTLTIKNMTNDRLSNTAIDAIGTELLDEEDIDIVEVKCTVSSDDSEFDVYDLDGGSYLFSVTNSGVVYNQ